MTTLYDGLVPRATETIQTGKEWLLRNLYRGAPCPLCGRYAKLYRRKINAGMADSLIKMYRINGTDWVHVPTSIGAHSREEGKLRYWDLVEEQSGKGIHGGRAGYWRVTAKGEQFILGKTTVPMYALVYNGRVMDHEGDQVTIQDALGTKFNYQELMDGI